jgi:prepilin-type N-terminal cleavage/methylation domain-containing protein
MTSGKFLKQRGFTTIEIIVVLIIIGVLLGLIVATHKGIEQKEDNTERQHDIDELHVALEAYYTQYNMYPTLNEVNNAAWRASNMKGMNDQVMHDPEGTSYELSPTPAKHIYAYKVTSTTGKPCDDIHVICTEYTLTATLDGGGTYVENSLD